MTHHSPPKHHSHFQLYWAPPRAASLSWHLISYPLGLPNLDPATTALCTGVTCITRLPVSCTSTPASHLPYPMWHSTIFVLSTYPLLLTGTTHCFPRSTSHPTSSTFSISAQLTTALRTFNSSSKSPSNNSLVLLTQAIDVSCHPLQADGATSTTGSFH